MQIPDWHKLDADTKAAIKEILATDATPKEKGFACGLICSIAKWDEIIAKHLMEEEGK